MGKRSSFERHPRDFYPTPEEAVRPLIPHLLENMWFIDPCAGDGQLVNHLERLGHNLSGVYKFDIEPKHPSISKKDAFSMDAKFIGDNADYIITNPPWDRKILHPMIDHFRNLLPTWLLFDAGWAYTKQSAPYIKYCSDIVAVGRVKWIPDSKMTGKDDCCWYQFVDHEVETRFHGRT